LRSRLFILFIFQFITILRSISQEPLSLIVDVLPHNEHLGSIIISGNSYFLTARGICTLYPDFDDCYSILVVDKSGVQQFAKHLGNKRFSLFSIFLENDTIFILNNDFLNEEIDWNIYLTNMNGDSLGIWEYPKLPGGEEYFLARKLLIQKNQIFIFGEKKYKDGLLQVFLKKLDKNGRLLAETGFDGFTVSTNHNQPGDFIQTSDGNFVITNRYQFYNTQSSKSDYMVGLCKFDRDFNIIWSQYLPPRGWDFYNVDAHIAETHDGGIVLSTGLLTADSIFSNPEYYLQLGKWPVMMYKFDKDGNINWIDTLYTKTIENTHGSSRQKVNKLITARNGDVIGIGTYSHPLTKPYDWGWLFRYSPDGGLLWERYYEEKDNQGSNHFSEVIEDQKNSIICLGAVINENQPANYHGHGWLLRVDSMGCFEPGCHTDSLSKLITPVEEISFESASRKILFFPNPANRDITVLIPDIWSDEKWQWEIYEINGRKVGEGALENNVHSRISGLHSLESGLYFIRFYSGSGVSVTEKLVVE